MTRPSEYTRERILKTAVRLFAERGYEATSVRTLATKAHVNQAAINYHFKTKGRPISRGTARRHSRANRASALARAGNAGDVTGARTR
jgi:AcrR family transcriptional regulator